MKSRASGIGIAIVHLSVVCAGLALVPSAAQAQIQAITVPWIPTNTSLPHITYAGALITLKGIARGGGNQYKWDFGDGTASSGWINFSAGQAWNLSTQHVYNGNVNQQYIATLSVTDGTTVATANYPVQMYQMVNPSDPNQDDVRIAIAEDEALWYLHVNQSRSTYGAGAPGYGQIYGYWGDQAGTCAALEAFELHGSKPFNAISPLVYATDPYLEDVQRTLNYIFYNATPSGISAQGSRGQNNPSQYGTPGVGIYLAPGDSTYTDGICAAALSAGGTGSSGLTAQTGNATYVHGRTFAAIMQDVVDWFAYGQADDNAGGYEGGWWYSANYGNGADGSTNQWPIIAMLGAETNMGAQVPAFVKAQAPTFLNTIHNTNTGSAYYGGYGYQTSTDYPNVAKTGGAIMAKFFLGSSNSDPDIQAGINLIYNRWNQNSTQTWYDYNLGDSYAMYDVMKAMQLGTPHFTRVYSVIPSTCAGTGSTACTPTGNSFDWYYTPAGQSQQGLADNIVSRQYINTSVIQNGATTNGYIQDTSNTIGYLEHSITLDTAWDTLVLLKAVASIPPVAKICNCSAQWPVNTPITLDGSCSTEPDVNRTIYNPSGYAWDYSYNGSTFTQSVDSNGLPVQGPVVIKPTGFSQYTEDASGNPLNPPVVFTVALQVTDNNPISQGGPLSSITTCNVIIKPPPHCPQANIGGPYYPYPNEPLQYSAAGSTQIDGDPLTYAWDFENLNLFTDSTLENPIHTFTSAGTYPIELQVTNHPPVTAAGQAPSCTVTAYTTVVVGHHTPIASAGGPYTALAGGETITLNATGSTDPDGNALSYAWDLTGNGLYADSTSATPSYTVQPGTPVGTTFNVCVRVSDAYLTSTPACGVVTAILAHSPPTCVIAPVAVQSCNGGALAVSVDGSHSTDPNGDAFTYAWTSADCPAFSNTTVSTPQITFQTAHEGCMPSCTATLTLTNAHNKTSTCSQLIKIADLQTPAFTTTPANTTIECNSNTSAAVSAWLSSAAATESCASPQAPVTLANDFRATAGACGGVGASGSVTGAVKVTWTAIDPCNTNTSQTSATLTVQDTTPPTLTLPSSPVTAQATSASGAVVTYAASAIDAATGSSAITISCIPASGSIFPIGTTTVTCTSTDKAGNTSTGQFNVVVSDTTAPTLSLGGNLSLSATSAAGAVGIYSVSANDPVDGPTTVTCVPPSGTVFPIGTTTVTCTSTDSHHNVATASFNVTVTDTTAPTVTVPAPITLAATSAAGATGTYTVTAYNPITGNTPVSCSPIASGGTFPIGTTTITCSSTAAGNTGTASFTVTVQNSTAPSFSGVASGSLITLEATGPDGTWLNDYGLSATDPVDGSVTVQCSPAAPYQFPLGETPVFCTATDSGSNTGMISFEVDVVDTTPPVLTCPSDITIAANGPIGAANLNVDEPTSDAIAAFLAGATAVDLVDPAPSLINNAPWLFPANQTTQVTFTSTDASQNSSTCTANVTVTPEQSTTPELICPASGVIASGSGAEIDWSAVFQHPVSVELLVVNGGGSGAGLSLADLGDSSFQLSAAPTSNGSFAVRLRAVDDLTGYAVDCNRFISVTPSLMPADQSRSVKRSAVPAIPVRY